MKEDIEMKEIAQYSVGNLMLTVIFLLVNVAAKDAGFIGETTYILGVLFAVAVFLLTIFIVCICTFIYGKKPEEVR